MMLLSMTAVSYEHDEVSRNYPCTCLPNFGQPCMSEFHCMAFNCFCDVSRGISKTDTPLFLFEIVDVVFLVL